MANQLEQLNISSAKPKLRIGSRLFEDAYASNGILLLCAGARIISKSILKRLQQPDVRFGTCRSSVTPLNLENEALLNAKITSFNPEIANYLNRIDRAANLKHDAIEVVKSVFDQIKNNTKPDIAAIGNTIAALLGDLQDYPYALISLTQLKDPNAYIFTHSVNVCILAMYLAIHTQPSDIINAIGTGALLHDLGRISVPQSILCKSGPLDTLEKRIIQQHPISGAWKIREAGEKNEIIISCIHGHHEKISGEGYPLGKKSEQINPYAMITAIADIYDALTTKRPYRAPYNPKYALEYMIKRMGNQLDPNLLQSFISIIGYYPVGSNIELSDGSVGTVLSHQPSTPDSPRVLLYLDGNRRVIPDYKVVDLSTKTDLCVIGLVAGKNLINAGSEKAA